MPYLFKTFVQLRAESSDKDHLDERLKEEVSNIIKTIDRELFELQAQEQAEFYIQKVELAVANYESSIKTDLQNNDSISRAKHLKSCIESLEDIRYHIEDRYSVYRNHLNSLSRKTLSEVSKNLEVKEEKLRSLLDKNSITAKLKNVILHPIQSIADVQNTEVSQQRIEYLTTFLDELIQFMESLEIVEEHQLLQYLYVLNYNSVALLCYICEYYKNLKGEIEDDQSLLDHLYQSKNQLNNIPQSIRRPYNADLNDLKIQVQTWIEEEIVIVKKAIKKKAKEKKESGGQKLKFNHSVDIITCFFRLLHDAEVIDSGANQTIRWITQNVSSKNQPHISQQSIQRKFFEKYPNKEPLKEIIIHLLNYLNHK